MGLPKELLSDDDDTPEKSDDSTARSFFFELLSFSYILSSLSVKNTKVILHKLHMFKWI